MSIYLFMLKIKQTFRKWPVSYFGIVGCILFLLFFVISIILHSITEAVNWTRHFVSNMGIGPNGSALAFSLGNFILGILIFPFILNLAQQLWIHPQETDTIPHAHLLNRLNFVGLIIAIISIPGIIVVAFYSMAPETIIPHAIGAMIFFFGTILYGSVFTIIIELRKKSTLGLRISSCCVILFFLGFIAAGAALVIMYPEEFQIFMASPMSYIVRILGDSVDTKLATIRVFEWLFVLAMNVWCVNLSLFSVRFEHQEKNSSH